MRSLHPYANLDWLRSHRLETGQCGSCIQEGQQRTCRELQANLVTVPGFQGDGTLCVYDNVFAGPGFALCSLHNIFYGRLSYKQLSCHSPAVDWSNSSCVLSRKL